MDWLQRSIDDMHEAIELKVGQHIKYQNEGEDQKSGVITDLYQIDEYECHIYVLVDGLINYYDYTNVEALIDI